MAALNHETLATIYGLELWRRTPVLVVEYFPGGTLAHRIEAGRMPAAVVVALAIRLARALVYMHEKGVLHRDLKPSNIAFTATGTPKLLDFGLATLIGSSMDMNLSEVSGGHSRLPAGTRAYLPPEAYQGAQPDPAFDLWALSVVMLEAITGRNPFATATHLHAIGKAADIDLAVVSALPPGTPPLLIAFFERALALRPELRFQTSLDMQCALDALVGVLGW